MELIKAVEERRSTRGYTDETVSAADIDFVLNAARLAPSWRNWQCWHFIVIEDKNTIKQIADSKKSNWLAEAPCLIVACADPELSGKYNNMDYYLVDVSIAMEHLVLAASDRGLGTCWIGIYDEEIIRGILKIPENIRVVAITPLGHPSEKGKNHREKNTKSLDEIVHRESW